MSLYAATCQRVAKNPLQRDEALALIFRELGALLIWP